MEEILKIHVLVLVDVLEVFLFAWYVLFQKMVLKWNKVGIELCLIGVIEGIIFWVPEAASVLLLLLFALTYIIFFEGGIIHCLFIFGTSYFFISYLDILSCLFMAILQEQSFYQYWEEGKNLILQCAVVMIGILLIGYAIRKEKKWMEFFRKIPDCFLMVITVCSFFFYFYMMSSFDFAKQYENYGLQNLVILGSVCVGTMIDFIVLALYGADKLKIQYQMESELKDDYLKASKDYCNAILENEKDVRKLRHDMKGHLVAIEYYAEHEKYDELKRYLGQINQQFDRISSIKTTGSELIDAILTKYQKNNRYISYYVTGFFSYHNMKDYDICVLFSNLISNAIEACEKLEYEKCEIEISFRQVGASHVILISNPIEKEMECNKLGCYTSKKDKKNHGFGIQRILEVVEKYNGTVDFREENQKFIATVILI